MEEVWRDISLANLRHGQRIGAAVHAQGHSYKTTLGARPSSVTPPPAAMEDMPTPPLRPSPSPLAVPQAALSFNSGLEFQFLGAPQHAAGASNRHSSSSFVSPALSAAAAAFPVEACRPSPCDVGLVSFDRHRRKLIKNREFAARSRARKQAYTNELELEVANLKEENAKLKMQHKELCLAMASQLSKRTQLQRSSTAPF